MEILARSTGNIPSKEKLRCIPAERIVCRHRCGIVGNVCVKGSFVAGGLELSHTKHTVEFGRSRDRTRGGRQCNIPIERINDVGSSTANDLEFGATRRD